MIDLTCGLDPRAFDAIAALEARTVAADGGRLKLEWGALRARAGDRVDDVLWWSGDRLLGFLGLYAHDGRNVELAGMVDPAARRQGIASALLDAALPLCRERAHEKILLVTPRASHAGRQLALARGAVLEHSEYALVLPGAPNDEAAGPELTFRTAEAADLPEVARLQHVAFGFPAEDGAMHLVTETARTLVIEVTGAIVGTLRVTREGDAGGIYGFAVDPAQQGRGIGREVLRRVCRDLRAEGMQRVGLEVAVQNERALGLYTSVGFVPVTTEDYYELPPRLTLLLAAGAVARDVLRDAVRRA